ncbi:MAG: carbohydrate ABC transporter permease [Butyrivibrio sp.]|jgi:putative aldouronate transport system permease protein|uniref:carbohydrate ABC transporter permease n=1 Tax=Butyrivibrio sp. LB2008 TaxID=1408305 RepID=UPI00055BDAC4|nr:carbohydrate ABC transporter permease [Butyrivibrio sp. LB2008]MEE3471315.1 carbohydrate ABC transporter permease [Butyrivibrio hungatei]MEE3494451.1 carbohydrate ABC transporter permease [Butyrivibrio sp.]
MVNMKKKLMASDTKIFKIVSTIILGLLALVALLPIILIVIASFTDETTLLRNGYSFFPEMWSADAYVYMIQQGSTIFRAYGISILVTIIGTVVSVLITTMIAYPMSRRNFKYKNALAFFVFFTMLFNGGVVPSYMMWTQVFQIKNTLWALIIPNYLCGAFNIFLVRNYYANSIPEALIESAQIDGASELTIFFKIIFPLAVPTVATISLFTALIYWNDWVNALYYIQKPQYYGIQNLLIRIMNNIQYLKSGAASVAVGTGAISLPSNAVRMSMAVIGILPIVVIYPFVQKYFVKGVVVGAVKG